MQSIDQDLQRFIRSRKLLTIATVDADAKPWVCNVYFSTDQDLRFCFVTPPSTNHSQHIEQEPAVAFSTAWYDENDLSNRKAIQGRGNCRLLTSEAEIQAALQPHLDKYPDWASYLTLDALVQNKIKSKLYIIEPRYIKFWNDELYGEEGTKEFTFTYGTEK
jgi:uncharacterized protein YhbP (UPF0306 family)